MGAAEDGRGSLAAMRREPVQTVRLDWAGRGGARGECAPAKLAPFEDGAGEHRLVQGDAQGMARALQAENKRPKLIYLDPPFASQADYVHEARLDGRADGRVVRTLAYEDKWAGRGVTEYLDAMAPTLEALAALLDDGGTIWVHLDWRASYLVRVLLDELFGRDSFVNEIVWRRAPNLGRQAASHQFGRTLDTIVVYAKGKAQLRPPTRLEPIEPSAIRWDEDGRPFTSAPRGDYTDFSIAKLERAGRVHRAASGKVYIKYFLVKNADGAWCRERRVDALWTDVPPLRHAATSERTGFPTQKPRALLDRIVSCATEPGDLVVDLFSGSGTTAESAFALGRRFVAGDLGNVAIATARARLLRAGCDVRIERDAACASRDGADLDVRFARAEDGRILVSLAEPREPFAWAIDAAHDPDRGFARAWHAERGLGSRPSPCPRVGWIQATGRDVAVRVYGEDGAVSTRVFDAKSVKASIAKRA